MRIDRSIKKLRETYPRIKRKTLFGRQCFFVKSKQIIEYMALQKSEAFESYAKCSMYSVIETAVSQLKNTHYA